MTGPVVRMWEAKAADGRLAEAIAYARDVLLPAALAAEGNLGGEAFASHEQGRVVVVTRWLPGTEHTWTEPPPPPGLWSRPPHSWPFTPL